MYNWFCCGEGENKDQMTQVKNVFEDKIFDDNIFAVKQDGLWVPNHV